MIFDVDRVTALVIEWQRTKDEEVLTVILTESTSLVEAIVSSYEYVYRDDLIQEAYYRIQYALPFFNPQISNLHNYLTTVIRNICNTWISRQLKEPDIELDLQFIGHHEEQDEDEVLPKLIIRNRKRFPSIPVDEIDHITTYIYYAIRDEGMNRRLVTGLSTEFGIAKSLAQILFQSTVAYLRALYIEHARIELCNIDELSFLPDFREVVGDATFNRLATIFSGMTIRFP